jgi:hypothetical protein
MQITISFPPGFEVEGVVLSLRGNSMRVAMRNWDDVAVFEFADGRWLSENGDPCRVYTSDAPAAIPEGASEEIDRPRLQYASVA